MPGAPNNEWHTLLRLCDRMPYFLQYEDGAYSLTSRRPQWKPFSGSFVQCREYLEMIRAKDPAPLDFAALYRLCKERGNLTVSRCEPVADGRYQIEDHGRLLMNGDYSECEDFLLAKPRKDARDTKKRRAAALRSRYADDFGADIGLPPMAALGQGKGMLR